MSIPKISIITPVFNNEKDIVNCIRSVANQTYKNIEHVIIDGGSKDRTVELLKSYSEKYTHIIWISEKDNGIYDAMNKGIKLASGDFLYFLGSDDILYNDTILLDIVLEFERYDLIYGNVLFKSNNKIYDGRFDKKRIIDQSICHQAAFFSRRVFTLEGYYNPKLKFAGDWDLFLRCFYNNNVKIKYLDKIFCVYNEYGISGYKSENRYVKYSILFNRLGIKGISKYLLIQIEKQFKKIKLLKMFVI